MTLQVFASQSARTMTAAPYVILYLVPAVIAAELAIYGWQRRQIKAAVPFSLLMAAVVFWSACHALSAAGSTFQDTLLWAQIQYGGIVLVGPIWLLFALAYGGDEWRVTPALRFGLILPATLSYAIVLTNDWHHLWWPNVALDASRPFGSLSITHGLLFWLHFGYSYSCVLLGFALIVRKLLAVPAPQQRQAGLVAAAALLPAAGNLAHVLGLRTSTFDDPTPFLFAATGLLVFYGALRYRFLGEQAQEASHARPTFLATVSHELRTPLTSIIGFIDMLAKGMFGELPPRAHEPLGHMRRNSQTLLRLINDILDFSKMEAGQFTVELSSVDLPAVIWDVAGAMRPQIEERGLELKVEIDPELPLVYANSERLEQVLTNLLSNAIKFTERGSITVRAARHGDHVQFNVADTGVGIAPEQQQVVFQEFQQIEQDSAQRYPGTGLGLPISRRLMQMMGGTLTLESVRGVGSTFYGEVPAVPESLRENEVGGTSIE
jgi:signal transduction histidine kinase